MIATNKSFKLRLPIEVYGQANGEVVSYSLGEEATQVIVLNDHSLLVKVSQYPQSVKQGEVIVGEVVVEKDGEVRFRIENFRIRMAKDIYDTDDGCWLKVQKA